MDVADWAAEVGFEVLEIACWPQDERRDPEVRGHVPHRRREPVRAAGTGPPRRDRGEGPDDQRPRLLPEPAAPGPARPRAAAIAHLQGRHRRDRPDGPAGHEHVLRRRCRASTSTRTGRRRSASGRTSFASRTTTASGSTFENCPMIFSYDEWPAGHNIAWSPVHLAPHPRGVGRHHRPQLRPLAPRLADDRPGPLHPRVRAAHPPHAGEGRADRPRRAVRARHAVGRHRLAGAAHPGPRRRARGRRSSPNLYRVGYDGPIIIEHEDKVFEGTDEKVKRGFLVARDQLRPFIR